MNTRIVVAILVVVLAAAGHLYPSSKTDPNKINPGDYRVIIPEFNQPPRIDGKLENPVWKDGAVLEKFTQYEPVEGGNPSERTVAYIGYDKNNLYLAIRCYDSNPKAVRACLANETKSILMTISQFTWTLLTTKKWLLSSASIPAESKQTAYTSKGGDIDAETEVVLTESTKTGIPFLSPTPTWTIRVTSSKCPSPSRASASPIPTARSGVSRSKGTSAEGMRKSTGIPGHGM